MPKPFLTKKEQEIILSTYSKNFDREFDKVGPYTFGTRYLYQISMCPEIDREGKNTGRILVNHYSYSYAFLKHIPEFIDVWEREDKEFIFKTRNLPGKDLISAEEKIKALEEELEGYKSVGIEDKSFAKLKYQQYKREMDERWEMSRDLYNTVVTRIHSYKEETDTYFRESPEYFELIKERDEALFELNDIKNKNNDLEERLCRVNDNLIKTSEQLRLNAELSQPLTHNARGAGRKKDPVVSLKKEKIEKFYRDGLSVDEICQRVGLGKSTCYKYIKEIRNNDGKRKENS